MTDDHKKRIRVEGVLRKLLRLANESPNVNEAANAMERAKRMAERHEIELSTILPGVDVGPLTNAAKADKIRGMSALFGGIQRAFPGVDTEDYSKGRKK